MLAPSGDGNTIVARVSSSLAEAIDGPILLTNQDSVPSNTMIELKKLGVTKVYLVGSTSVISSKVESAFTAAGIQSVRVSGNDRYETAVNIAMEIQQIRPHREIVVTNSNSNADAISIAPIAAAKGIPILLVDTNRGFRFHQVKLLSMMKHIKLCGFFFVYIWREMDLIKLLST